MKKLMKLDLSKYNYDSLKGCILEVHFEYHSELHNLHNNYPLAHENIEIKRDVLSNYCLRSLKVCCN